MKIQILLLVLFISITYTRGQGELTVVDHQMTISGTSTMHDWVMSAEKMAIEGQFNWVDADMAKINDLIVSIEATDLKSDKGKIMDKNTFKAIKGDACPEITFELTGVSEVQKSQKNFTIVCEGNLTLAGTQKPITIETIGTWVTPDQLIIRGTEKLNMTTFGIEPPKFFMGALKTGDEVEITFEVTMSLAESAISGGK